MKYQRMKFGKILKELDSEEKARAWIWLAKFNGKEFFCPKCQTEHYYQHKKNPEIRKCKSCSLQVRIRANTIFQNSKIPLLIWLKALCFITQGKRGISALELQSALEINSIFFTVCIWQVMTFCGIQAYCKKDTLNEAASWAKSYGDCFLLRFTMTVKFYGFFFDDFCIFFYC